jgi:hypothetical protein
MKKGRVAKILTGSRSNTFKKEIHLQQLPITDIAQPMKFYRVNAAKPHLVKLCEDRFGGRTPLIEFDQRNLNQDVVGLAQYGFAPAQYVQFRTLRIYLDEIEALSGKKVINPRLLHGMGRNNFIAEIMRIFPIKRCAG